MIANRPSGIEENRHFLPFDRPGFTRVADQIESTLGAVSLVVNNASVVGGAPAPKMTCGVSNWVNINLGGIIHASEFGVVGLAKSLHLEHAPLGIGIAVL